MTIDQLFHTLVAKKNSSADVSYTASLFAGGGEKLAKKFGEESIELVIEAIKVKKQEKAGTEGFIAEAADVMYHYLALLAYFDISPDQICAELERRSGQSGLEEKKNRGVSAD